MPASEQASLPCSAITAQCDVSIVAVAGADGTTRRPRIEMRPAYSGGLLRVASYDRPVIVDLATLRTRAGHTPVLSEHRTTRPVGQVTTAIVEQRELHASGTLARNRYGKAIAMAAADGFPWQASITVRPGQVQRIEANEAVQVNGQAFRGPCYVARAGSLAEISIVAVGADEHARTLIAAKEGTMPENAHTPADPVQTPVVAPVPTAPVVATHHTPAPIHTPSHSGGGSVAEVLHDHERELQRQTDIAACLRRHLSNCPHQSESLGRLAEGAIQAKMSVEAFDLAAYRLGYAQGPIGSGQVSAPRASQNTYEAALLLACGVADEKLVKDRNYGERVVEAAWPMRDRGLRAILASVYRDHAQSDVPSTADGLLKHIKANPEIKASGFSTISVPGILGNVANKLMLEAFTAFNSVYQMITEQRDFANFHTHTMYRLDHLGDFKEVPKGGSLDHGSLSESSYTNQLRTYGQMLALSRQDVINDDLGAFQTIVAQLARKAKITIDKAVFALVMEGSDVFYTAGRGNRLTSSALAIATLGSARAAMAKMADASGNPLGTEGRYLLTPVELEPLAMQLYTSTHLVETGNTGTTTKDSAQRPQNNPFVNKYTPVASPWLSTATMTGQSATTWYLIADPQVLPAFQVGYLQGRRTPVIETSEMEFSTLGIQMRAYFDFGAARIDHRGAVKATA